MGRVRALNAGTDDVLSADEVSADVARQRLRKLGIVAIKPDHRIGALLAPDEAVVAVRHSVRLERRHGPREGDAGEPAGAGLAGDLYVTTRRLVHLGRSRVDYGLGEIRDAVEAPGALRLIVGQERGIEITVPDPRVLRVEIAAVREAARAAVSVKTPAAGTRDGGDLVRLRRRRPPIRRQPSSR